MPEPGSEIRIAAEDCSSCAHETVVCFRLIFGPRETCSDCRASNVGTHDGVHLRFSWGMASLAWPIESVVRPSHGQAARPPRRPPNPGLSHHGCMWLWGYSGKKSLVCRARQGGVPSMGREQEGRVGAPAPGSSLVASGLHTISSCAAACISHHLSCGGPGPVGNAHEEASTARGGDPLSRRQTCTTPQHRTVRDQANMPQKHDAHPIPLTRAFGRQAPVSTSGKQGLRRAEDGSQQASMSYRVRSLL